ncbi:MAG TPA: biotin/lipoyl-containing protein, partial [Bacteroidales bacterium]|nr:biotin/lipoyl-containing protein [Bacteroidales bacterium]
MANFNIVMPKLGESVIEATIIRWLKKEGETVAEDEPVVEIATDKVDSEIPSPVEGTIQKILFSEGDVVAVGEVIAIITISGGVDAEQETIPESASKVEIRPQQDNMVVVSPEPLSHKFDESQKVSRFYSPLVKNIAREENLTLI